MQELILYEGAKLTPKQRERLSSLLPFYGEEDAMKLLSLLAPRGTNSWPSVLAKLTILMHSSYLDKEYEASLYYTFALNENWPFDKIIEEVFRIRNAMRLPIYTERIKMMCERDFLNLFIVRKVYSDPNNTNSRVIGYCPVFKIKPE